MANRLAGNVLIIDSAMGNLGVFMSTGSFVDFQIAGISFWYATTLGNCIITATNTADPIVRFNLIQVGTPVALGHNPHSIPLACPIKLSELKVPTLTAGTAWVYLA